MKHPHPEILWTPEKPAPAAPALEIVRQRGGELPHQRPAGAPEAFCGFVAARWVVMPTEPPRGDYCRKCWEAAGKLVRDALGLTPETMHTWAAWPFQGGKES